MKKLITLLMAVVLVCSCTGCSLFSSSKDDAKDPASTGDAAVKYDDYAITDTYTHQDPADLEFATRTILSTGKENPEFVQPFKEEYGVDFVEQLAVIYVNKDDKVVGEYDYYVFKTPEDAESFGKAIDTASRDGIIKDTVVCEFLDEETVNQIINIDKQYGSIDETTGTAYVTFMKDINAMMTVD